MHREVMESRHRVFGEDHQDTLNSMNNLASAVHEQGQWQEADKMHREVLEGMRRVLAKDHQQTLGSMNNLACVFHGQGKWQEAEEKHREVNSIGYIIFALD